MSIFYRQAVLKRDAQSLHVFHHWLGSQLDFAGRRSQYFRNTGLERAKVNAVWMSLQSCKAETILPAKSVAIWTAAQQKVQRAFRPAPGFESLKYLRLVPACER